MVAESMAIVSEEPRASQAIIWGGLTAGILDIAAAFVSSGLRGASPMRVLQVIASGLLGTASYTGGIKSAAVGAAIHFLIAFVACAVYYAVSRKITVLVRRPVICGLLYGAAVYLFMYGVVLPLTFHRGFFQQFSAVATGLLIHLFCVGLPIALVVSRFSVRRA